MKRLLSVLSVSLLLFSSVASAKDNPTKLDGVTVVGSGEVEKLIKGGVTVFDVRKPIEYAEGHITGAKSLFYDEKSKKEVDFDASVDKFDDSKLPASDMLFYCNGPECWKSYKASIWALKKGKKNIYWFRGGLPEWEKAGKPVSK